MTPGAFFRNPDTGHVVVAQPPNLPLGIFIGASIAGRVFDLDVARVVAIGALGWWAIAEIVDGDSPFRRVLGGAVLAGVAVATLT